ncbi:MAG: 3-hydroxyacyl-CoA dehydrogenase NAD-binding domain-containing protein [Candidatus Neomarinimicrobiota bacterium]|nr:MAG: 3-hydroxyacyl-CoA dehydrogenase [bacterium]
MYKKDSDCIVTISLETEKKNPDSLNHCFDKILLEYIEKLENDTELKGIIITSTEDSFLAKYDIENLFDLKKPDICFEYIENQKSILRRIEKLKVPVVAAINGSSFGIGMELALACNHRIGTQKESTRFEFSEVKYGILPGYGGIIRLIRTMGIEKSLKLLLGGNQFNVKEAIDFGFLDELASSYQAMIEKSVEWIKSNQNIVQPWDQKNFTLPEGNAHEGENANLISLYPAIIRKKTKGNFPAPETILSIAAEGSLVDFKTASRVESRFFTELLLKKTTKNILNANWYQLKNIRSGLSRPEKPPKTTTSKVGVLGAGLMGHGISYVSAKAGLNVIMIDSNKTNADRGLKNIKNILLADIEKQNISNSAFEKTLKRITATSKYSQLDGCDLVIEAVFEDENLKGSVTIEAEKNIKNDKVFASNTSTIPITTLAEKSNSPENFIGVHFFSPVNRMKLVEIIKGEKTSPYALAKAFDYALKIGKIPIVVNDKRGFFTTRVFERYAKEGMALLSEGNHPVNIESAGKIAGFPVGPLAVIDEISIQLLADIRSQSRKDSADKKHQEPTEPWDKVIDYMLGEAKRPGRASGKGFYEYSQKNEKYMWPGIVKRFHSSQNQLSQKEMMERFYFSQAIEAVRCLEEKVLLSVADANIGSIYGWGFPLFTGGVIQYINNYGLEKFRNRANKLSNKYGERFYPPKLLDQMIENGKTLFR